LSRAARHVRVPLELINERASKAASFNRITASAVDRSKRTHGQTPARSNRRANCPLAMAVEGCVYRHD